jgi:hypothetical protein
MVHRPKVSVPQRVIMKVLLALLPSHPANGKIAAYIKASITPYSILTLKTHTIITFSILEL